MTAPERGVTAAWHELLDGLRGIDAAFLEGGCAVHDDQGAADGYRMALTALGVALDTYLFADASRPLLVDVASPVERDRRWGGDNTDSWYSFTPIDPRRCYRVTGHRGDSAYFCFTIYNEPSPGEWSNRIVANVNDTDLDLDADGRFSFVFGPAAPEGFEGHFVPVDDEGAVAFTRDYQVDALAGRRVTWTIEALDPPGPLDRGPQVTAAALRSSLRWVRTLFDIVPLQVAPADAVTTAGHNVPVVVNEFADPYQVVGASYGWSALDAVYGLATFALEPGQALVVTHRPPTCRFWNLVVWNAFMATESLLDARTSINMGRAVLNADGTVTVVIGHEELAHPNAVSTAGRRHGALAFRWFLADSVPDRPTIEVVGAADAPDRAVVTAEAASAAATATALTHLQRLEAESIQILREAVAESERPVMLYSIGKDSSVMLRLAQKAFYPSVPPFPLLHVDTTWKFRAMYEIRERAAADTGMELLVHQNPDCVAQGINPFTHGSSVHTDLWKTQGLKQALDAGGFDAAFGGARRDEERSRAKERIFSVRSAQHRWDPKAQRPELWRTYNVRRSAGETLRVFPLSNWTELDIWQYVHLEAIPIVPLYLAVPRPVVERNGTLVMVDDDRMPLEPGEEPQLRSIRFRTLGCYPLTGAVESTAATLPAVIQEMLLATTSEREGRMIDFDSSASMEKKKQEGYF